MIYLRVFSTLALSILVSACVASSQSTPEELQRLEHPPATVKAKVEKFFPLALAWYNHTEQQLLPQGRALSAKEQAIARQLGIKQPQKIRLLALETFPMPEDKALRAEAERYGLGSPQEAGRTIGYAVLLKAKYARDKALLAHELVHVQQIERMGQAHFLKRYLLEMETVGYTRSPLELEAYRRQQSP